MMAKKRPRKTYHHGDLRSALVRVALAHLAEVGLEGFSLREIARKAGVSPAAPYNHFADKDALLAAAAAEASARLGAAMDEAQAAAGGDLLLHFRASGVAYVRFAYLYPAHFRALNLPELAGRDEVAPRIEEWMVAMAQGLRAAQEAGQLGHFPVPDIIAATQALTHGLAHRVVEDATLREQGWPAIEALVHACTEVLGYGLLPR